MKLADAAPAGYAAGTVRMLGVLADGPQGVTSVRYEYLNGLLRALRCTCEAVEAEIRELGRQAEQSFGEEPTE